MKFENLKVWNKSLELTGMINDLTKKFPNDERFVLTTQVKRAADSICLNIAEGSTGQSNAEFKKFLGYALRSGIEVIACLYIAKRRALIEEIEFNQIYISTEEIIKMIQGLRNTLT